MKDKNIIIFYGGLILLQYMVKFLKKIIKQERPVKSNTYGMPSTKSATLFYIMTYLIIMNNLKTNMIMILIVLAIIGILYKIIYKEHSYKQITVGGIIGVIYAYFIKWLIN
jgi:acid phosphatase family membrane protein YuiD